MACCVRGRCVLQSNNALCLYSSVLLSPQACYQPVFAYNELLFATVFLVELEHHRPSEALLDDVSRTVLARQRHRSLTVRAAVWAGAFPARPPARALLTPRLGADPVVITAVLLSDPMSRHG